MKAEAILRVHGPWIPRAARLFWWLNDIPLDVVVDGQVVGQVWGYQTSVFDVTPGSHSVQLRRGWLLSVLRSRSVTVTAAANEVVDLASSALPLLLAGTPGLRFATPRDIARADAGRMGAPTSRNLVESGDEGT